MASIDGEEIINDKCGRDHSEDERSVIRNVGCFTPEDTNHTLTTSSSQLLSCPVDNVRIHLRELGATSLDGVSAFLSQSSVRTSNSGSNNGSYFILDEVGRYVLDDQGSPARTRKWQPSNAIQRARYRRLQIATKGPRATYRWLPSILITPDYLRFPRERSTGNNDALKRVIFSQFQGVSITTGGGGSRNGCHSVATAQQYREINHAKLRQKLLTKEKKRERPKELNGFMLLDACDCELPNEGRRADVSGRGLVGVVQEDLRFFIRLRSLDAGDNSLQLNSFALMPRLEELRLPCNGIRDVVLPKRGYTELTRLDLSYNSLSNDALSVLGRLPNLTDLDLTCNGLVKLPEAMGVFFRLQKLSLERNKLEGDIVIDVLSKLPALQELNLAFNYFTCVTLTPEAIENAFVSLECLDLGFNYINSENDVAVLVLLAQLQRIVLYGNPLAGPTGEDPLGLRVEHLLDKANSIRKSPASSQLEFITEMPHKKLTKGGGGRRRRPYCDMGVTMVDETCLPSAAAFRAAGNESLFHTEALFGPEPPEAIAKATIQSAKDYCTKRPSSRPTVDLDATFITGIQRHDDVKTADNNYELSYGATNGLHSGFCGMSTRQLRGPVNSIARSNPVKLRMAFMALRHTLKHPVISSMDIPLRSELQGKGVATNEDSGFFRNTVPARARRDPRRPCRLLRSHQKRFCDMLDGSPSSSHLGEVG